MGADGQGLARPAARDPGTIGDQRRADPPAAMVGRDEEVADLGMALAEGQADRPAKRGIADDPRAGFGDDQMHPRFRAEGIAGHAFGRRVGGIAVMRRQSPRQPGNHRGISGPGRAQARDHVPQKVLSTRLLSSGGTA